MINRVMLTHRRLEGLYYTLNDPTLSSSYLNLWIKHLNSFDGRKILTIFVCRSLRKYFPV